MQDREIRAFDFEVRAEENEEHGHFLTGRPIVFNRETDLGWCTEIIDERALDNADLKDVRFLINHNTDMVPLARSRNNTAKSTMQMQVLPGVGMDIRVDLDIENNTDARSLYSAVKRGDISGMSFMMTVDGNEYADLDSEKPKRTITSIRKVFEVSAVTWPAYEQTKLEARGMAGALESAKAALESAKAEKRKAEAEKERRKQRLRILMEVTK